MTATIGNIAVAAAIVGVLPSAAAAEWRRAESANFVVYSEAGEAKVLEQVALLEDYHEFLRSLTAVKDPPSPNKLPVYMLRDRGDLRLVRDVGRNVAGFYVASGSGIAAFATEPPGPVDPGDEILLHEIAHHFMLQYRPTAYPAWFVEGFAEYVATARFTPATIEFGKPSETRAGWLRNVNWLPIERVLFSPPAKSGQEMTLFYAQSWLLTHFVMRDPDRSAKFRAYVAATVSGIDPRKAFIEAFGDVRTFDRALETYARRQMTYTAWMRASTAATPSLTIRTLPAAANELLLAQATMHLRVGERYAPALLARIRTGAARFPADGYARRVLAEAEVLLGDGAKGEAMLDALLAKSPADAELLYLKGMRHLVPARRGGDRAEVSFKAARTWFARAHKADENHFPTLVRYAESLQADPRFNSDNTLNILLLAHDLAPQVNEVTMHSARLLIMRGEFDDAEALLLPLASHPHNEGLAAAAGKLLLQARAKSKMPVSDDAAGPPAAAAASR